MSVTSCVTSCVTSRINDHVFRGGGRRGGSDSVTTDLELGRQDVEITCMNIWEDRGVDATQHERKDDKNTPEPLSKADDVGTSS
ncbi:hypothetical protein EYF80_058323 [Liparis tanakae]|uniref:Uncharacterized protein n=1 Tax=Liparis tanakae TaxID=230148 RepID=A0A4Z2ERW3_9TELE|nr:hypothetical protein EYF80_058323 [Liparis tanakae]